MNFLKIRQQQSCKLLTVHASWRYNDSRHEFSIFARSVSRPALKPLIDSRTRPQCLRRRRSRYKLPPSLVRCTNRPFGHQRRCVERLIITTSADFTECTAPLIRGLRQLCTRAAETRLVTHLPTCGSTTIYTYTALSSGEMLRQNLRIASRTRGN